MYRQTHHFLVGAIFLLVLALVSCSQESPTYLEPIYQVGALEGYVMVAGEPRSVTVGAREVGLPGMVIARTQSGEDGWYRLELPVDRYRIEINPGGGGFSSSDTSNVVRVEPQSKRLDLLRGRLVIRVETPESMIGLWLEALPISTGRYVRPGFQRSQIENPITDLTFDILEPETFNVQLRLANGARYWLPGTYDREAAQQITVPTGQETVAEVTLSQYASLSGSVVGSWQQANPYGPDVKAYNLDMQLVAQTRVANDGTFQLHLLIAEPVKIQVGSFSGVKQWFGGNSFESANLFDPQVGEDVGGLDLVESGIQVQLEGPGTFFGHQPRFLITDDNGWEFELDFRQAASSYSITNLLPGRYYLHVSGICAYDQQPWKPQWFGGTESFDSAIPIDLPAAQLKPITMQLTQGGVIEGQVLLDPPYSGIRVGIFDASGTPLCEDFNWWEDGEFRFAGLTDGDYLVAVANNDERWWYPGTSEVGNATAISIRDAQTVSGITWPLGLE